MEFTCPLCPRRNIYQYMYYQHQHIEHRRYECEVCKEELPSRKSYKQHQSQKHNMREHDLIEERWNYEREFEKMVDHEVWVKSMLADSTNNLVKIRKSAESILSDIFGDITGAISECQSDLIQKMKDVVTRLQYEELVLEYYADIDGTVSKFAQDVDVYPPPKYIPELPPRPEWTKCGVDKSSSSSSSSSNSSGNSAKIEYV